MKTDQSNPRYSLRSRNQGNEDHRDLALECVEGKIAEIMHREEVIKNRRKFGISMLVCDLKHTSKEYLELVSGLFSTPVSSVRDLRSTHLSDEQLHSEQSTKNSSRSCRCLLCILLIKYQRSRIPPKVAWTKSPSAQVPPAIPPLYEIGHEHGQRQNPFSVVNQTQRTRYHVVLTFSYPLAFCTKSLGMRNERECLCLSSSLLHPPCVPISPAVAWCHTP